MRYQCYTHLCGRYLGLHVDLLVHNIAILSSSSLTVTDQATGLFQIYIGYLYDSNHVLLLQSDLMVRLVLILVCINNFHFIVSILFLCLFFFQVCTLLIFFRKIDLFFLYFFSIFLNFYDNFQYTICNKIIMLQWQLYFTIL